MRKFIGSFSFFNGRIKDLIACAVIAAVVCIAFSAITFFGLTMKWDMANYFLSIRYLIGYSLQHRVLPVWNPYLSLGYPLASSVTSGVWYPPVWFFGYLFGYNATLINVECVLHLVIAGTGFYYFMRTQHFSRRVALLMGCTYALSGFFVSNAQHLNFIIGAAWLPVFSGLLIRAIETGKIRHIVASSLVLFMMVTGGYPAIFIILFYIILVYFLFLFIKYIREKNKVGITRILKIILGVGACTSLLCAYPLLLYQQAAPFITRGHGISLAFSLSLPFPVEAWLSFLNPVASLNPSAYADSDISMINAYFGIGWVLVLGIAFFYKRPLFDYFILFISLFFLATSAGSLFPFRSWLYELLPGMNLFRFPAIFRLFVIIGFIWLTARTLESDIWQRHRIKLWILLSGGVLLFSQAYLLLSLHSTDFNSEDMPIIFGKAISPDSLFYGEIAIQSISVIVFIVIFLKYKNIYTSFLLLFFTQSITMILSVQSNSFATIVANVKTSVINKKIASYPGGFLPDSGEVIGTFAHFADPGFSPVVYNANLFARTLAFDGYEPFELNSTLNFVTWKINDKIAEHKLFYFPDTAIIQNNYLFPRDRNLIPPNAVMVNREQYQALRGIISNYPRRETSLKLIQFKPDYTAVSVRCNKKELLCFMQNYYPGWKCYVDGQDVPIQKVNVSLQSVIIKPGNHSIVFAYVPLGWFPGFYITAGSFCLLLFFWLGLIVFECFMAKAEV